MTAARFLLAQLIIALLLIAAFFAVAAAAAGGIAGVIAPLLIGAALLCLTGWLLQARVFTESTGVIREIRLTDMGAFQHAELTIESIDPPLTIRETRQQYGLSGSSVGDQVRLLVPIHPAPGAPRASVIEGSGMPAITGYTVLLGSRIRFGLGRLRRLAGRPVWQAMPAEELLDRITELISDVVLGWHRRRCRQPAESLHLTPEFLALDAVFDVTWHAIFRRALREQGEIFDATTASRSRALRALMLLLAFTVLLAPAVVVLPDVLRVLWAATSALAAGTMRPLTDRIHWDAAVAASGLPHLDLYVALCSAAVVFVAVVDGLARSARAYRLALRAWRRDLTDVIRRRLRLEYQRVANKEQPPMLDIRSAPGLAVLSADQVIAREEAARLRGLAFDLGAGAVAISGARGVGKTTLLRAVASGEESDALGMVVSAPVRYEPRDFLLHLYGQLCRTVLERLGDGREGGRLRRMVSRARRVLAALVRTAAVICLLAVVFAGTREWFATRWPIPRLAATYVLAGLALVVLARWIRGPSPAKDLALAAEAARRLRQTRFLQTVSAERSAGAGRGALQIGLRRARQWAEQPHSLPELVDSYRTFATSVAEWWRGETGGRGKLVIAVDEADRIADPRLAEQFVNEVKATFGVPHCVFLVSMSDEALAGFERRLMRMRTVFDSAFDHVVRLRELSVSESVQLLQHRVAGVPDAFWILCHCIAGGMPRDVLRTARTMLDLHRGSTGPTSLPDMAQRLVALEVQAVKQAVQHEAAAEVDPKLRESCTDAGWPGPASSDIRRAARSQLPTDSAAGSSVAAYFLYYALVLDLFAAPRLPDADMIVELTTVHRLLLINPAAAVAELEHR